MSEETHEMNNSKPTPLTAEDGFFQAEPPVTENEPVEISPENHWREVWHTNCKAGRFPSPMLLLHGRDTLTIEDGSTLHIYKCVACDAQVFAGLDKKRMVVRRQVEKKPPILSPAEIWEIALMANDEDTGPNAVLPREKLLGLLATLNAERAAKEATEKERDYAKWRAEIAVIFINLDDAGAAHQVLVDDEPWREWFDEGMTSRDAANAEMESWDG